MPIQQLPFLPPSDGPTRWRRLVEAINALIKAFGNFYGSFNATFNSGWVVYGGPDNSITANGNMIFGSLIPQPGGVNGPVLLLGTGFGPGGSPTPQTFWISSDQAYDNATPGNILGITAGETQGAGTAAGGLLWLIGGASFGGKGGEMRVQGGTSANGAGGDTVVSGGNATGPTGAAIPGDLFLIGGQVGKQGANVHLIATLLNGIAGDVRIRINSTILIQFLQNGEIYLTASGTGAGLAGQPLVSGGVGAAAKWLTTGFTGTITTAKLTPGGANGSMTFSSGILTAQTAAT